MCALLLFGYSFPPFLSLETNTSPSPGAPGSFSTHSSAGCRALKPLHKRTRLESAQVDDNPPHSHLFLLAVPSPFEADLSRCIVHTIHGRVWRHLIGFLHCFELCFRGELLSTLAGQNNRAKTGQDGSKLDQVAATCS